VEENHQLEIISSRQSFSAESFSELGGISGAPVFSAADHPRFLSLASFDRRKPDTTSKLEACAVRRGARHYIMATMSFVCCGLATPAY
jgi:hypothetical protein